MFAVLQTEAESLPSLSTFCYRRPSDVSGRLELIYKMLSSSVNEGTACAMDAMGCVAVVRR